MDIINNIYGKRSKKNKNRISPKNWSSSIKKRPQNPVQTTINYKEEPKSPQKCEK